MPLKASQFLNKGVDPLPSLVVLFGGDPFLSQTIQQKIETQLFGDDVNQSDASITPLSGKTTDYKTFSDEMRTISMWGSGKLVVVTQADDFVSQYRSQLEQYAQKPVKKSTCLLMVKSFPGNTKLAKQVEKTGLVIDCKEMTAKELNDWLMALAKNEYNKQLPANAAHMMQELAGQSLGILTQELEKLVSYVGDRTKITTDDVTTLVGGWRLETTWTMLNAVRDNNMSVAMSCLNQLLVAGEAPQKLMGGIHFVFRKYAKATELSRVSRNLTEAMKDAAIFPRDQAPTEAYLRRIGRKRAERILARLTRADYDLKGGNATDLRHQLELLLLELAGQVPMTTH